MEDYFISVNKIDNAMEYIELVSRKFKDKKEDVIISLTSEESLELYDNYPLIDFGESLGINIIPSVLFKTKNDVDILILDPKPIIHDNCVVSGTARSLLSDIRIEKSNRIVNMIYRLSNFFSIHITPSQLVNSIGKSDINDIWTIRDDDIIKFLVDNDYCKSVNECRQQIYNQIVLPRILPTYSDILEKLKNDNIWLIYDGSYMKDFVDLDRIKGFISKDIFDGDLNKIAGDYNLSIKKGSGTII